MKKMKKYRNEIMSGDNGIFPPFFDFPLFNSNRYYGK